MKKICVFTGTRAEYGLLKPLMKKINIDNDFVLQIIASGMHLSPEFGLTYKQIEDDGFLIDEKIDILLSSDRDEGINKTIGLGIISITDVFSRLKPDYCILLGDRYETFAAAVSAYTMKIPIIHISGGVTTEGAYDEAYRHSITKMSYLHFTATEEYRNRVIQLGEDPQRVFNVGAIGLDNIKEIELLSKKELEKELDFTLGNKSILVTFHPTTLEIGTANVQIDNLLNALDKFRNEVKIVFTKSNSDSMGRLINQKIDEFVKTHENSKAYFSLGTKKYLSLLQYVDCVVGNSSSGIIEVPSFKKATINIGDRQKGRFKPISIIDCECTQEDIEFAIKRGMDMQFKDLIKEFKNPYGDGNTSDKIINILKSEFLKEINLKKSFYNIRIGE